MKQISLGIASVMLIALVVWMMISLVSCSSTTITEQEAEVVTEDNRIFIVDQTGKKWDVTEAVRTYRFVASQFEFGLGPNAIRPIIDPEMLSPGDGGYGPADKTDYVIGTTLEGESRAYPINVLNLHEVVDDAFGDVHVAVGW
jgi:hypothetical protein